ncbi:hypothetical protein [Labrys miyagiensis]|nr:hypothetical protein [Labrys miyagiensis]
MTSWKAAPRYAQGYFRQSRHVVATPTIVELVEVTFEPQKS